MYNCNSGVPEGSHNALFTNLLAAPLSILADAAKEKKHSYMYTGSKST